MINEPPSGRSRRHAPDDTPPEERWQMLHRHREEAIAAVRRVVGDAAEAEDCVQDAVVRLVQRGDLDPERVRSLLTRTALHIAIDRRRTRRREEAVATRLGGDAARETTSPEQVVTDRAEVERVMAAVGELPRREREVLLMRLSGLSVSETAERLGVTYKSIEGAYTRARARVRLILGSALGWLAFRLRRAPHQPGEAFAAAAAVLFFLAPFWHHGADAEGGSRGRTSMVSASRAVLAPQPQGEVRSPRVRPGPAVAAELRVGTLAPGGGGGDGHDPKSKTYVSTSPIVIPDPRGDGNPPLLYVGPFTVTGPSSLQEIDPVHRTQQCLAQGGPAINLEHGGCNT
jgi:RNA polymerase sigma factor (sigma-70 family)